MESKQMKISVLSIGIIACVGILIAFGLTSAEKIMAGGDECIPELALECEYPNVFMNCQCLPPWPTPTPTPLAYGPKGVGDPWQNWRPSYPGTNIDALDFDWYYDWSTNYVSARDTDPRYVRMVWCMGTEGIVAAASTDFANGIRGRVWLVYNEPDHKNTGQCGSKFTPSGERMNSNAPYAARHFSDIYDMIKGTDPHARIFAGGLVLLNTQRTRDWWQEFINTLQADSNLHKLEGVHIHLYPLVSTVTDWNQTYLTCNTEPNDYCIPALAEVANQWYQDMHVDLGLGDRPIWITEMGQHCYQHANSTTWVRDNAMIPMAQWFAQDPAWPYPQVTLNPGYDAVSWFATYYSNTGPCHRLLDSQGSSGTPTVLGQFWNGYQP